MKILGPGTFPKTIYYLLDTGFFENVGVDWDSAYQRRELRNSSWKSKKVPWVLFYVGRNKELNECQKVFFDFLVKNASEIEQSVRSWLMNRELDWLVAPSVPSDLDGMIGNIQIWCKSQTEYQGCLGLEYLMQEKNENLTGSISLLIHQDGRLEEVSPEQAEQYLWG